MTLTSFRPMAIGAESAADWHFLSHVVIRRAGFPFDWLDRLATPAAAEHVAALVTETDAFGAASTAVLKIDFPAAVAAARAAADARQLHALSKLRGRVGRRQTLDADLARFRDCLPADLVARLQTLAERARHLEAARADAAEVLDTDLRSARAELRALADDGDFQQAIFLSNPDLYASSLQRLVADPDRLPDPALERKLLAYLQRLCAKNDTASFFGPLNCGRVVADQVEPLSIETSPGKYSQREVFIGFWVANRLAQSISADPRLMPFLAPRIHPLCRVEPGGVLFPSRNVRARLGALQQTLLAQVDGRTSVAQIGDAIGEPLERTVDLIAQLVSARVLVCRLEIPSTIFHPFSYLLQRIEQLPAAWPTRQHWLAELRRFEALRDEFVGADLSRRQQLLNEMGTWFEATTGRPPRRSAGATYADRSLVYEDCAGTFERFQFSRRFFDDLQQRLTPLLDLCAAHGGLLWHHYQRLGKAVFAELSPDGSSVSYARFVEAIRRQPTTDPTADPAVRDLYAALHRKVAAAAAAGDGRVARLDAADLAELLAAVPPVRNCHLSPDIMLSAPDVERLERGEYQVVLGEIHQVFYAWGSQLYFWPERLAAEAEMAAHVERMPDYAGLATVLNERQHKGLLHETFPGTIIEVAALPSEQARERIPLAQLEVALDAGQLTLRDAASGRVLRLYTAGDEQLHLWAFGLPRTMPVPVRLGVHTPRIELGGVVYQRERWQLSAAEWGPSIAEVGHLELLERVAHVRRRHHLPRRIYVLAPNEPKPFCIDLDSALSIRLLQPLVATNPHVVITEMLPGPEQLWLADADGRYCCEFRMTACRY